MSIKTASILLAVLLALAPAAQAQSVAFSMPCPMAQAPAGPEACCGDKCDCSIGSPADELASVLPAALPSVELSVSHRLTPQDLSIPSSDRRKIASEEGSPPPSEPLYQTYSDYRL